MKLAGAVVLLVILAGCSTASRVVRLDTGQADTLVFTPRSGAELVKLETRSRRVTPLWPDEHLEGTPPAAEVR